MRDFMPCKGCDEPEACEIEGRCLEPAPGPLRLLTPAEHFQIGLKEPVRIADIEAIQRKFCEVNGLTLGVPGTTPNPCKLTECQGKPRCEKCVAMGLNDPRGAAGMTLATDANDEDPHVMSALNAGVQRADALTEAELVLLDRILEGFADCGETDEGHDVLLNFARRGYLECERYAPTDKSHQALAAWRAGGVGEVPGG